MKFSQIRFYSALCLILSLGSISRGAPRPNHHPKCVQIFYDSAPFAVPAFKFGRVHAQFLQNLLAHFSNIEQRISPVESYIKGSLDQCAANFYLGIYFDNSLPKDFLDDFANSKTQNVWFNYNLWKLSGEQQTKLFGARYQEVTGLDWKNLDPKGEPGFFRSFSYKGELFTKSASWPEPKKKSSYQAAYELVSLEIDTENPPQVISWSKHSGSQTKKPYIIRNKNLWFVADSPFSFLHEADRYLIFSDVLFDILNEPARYPNKKPAFIRFEDIHVKIPKHQLDSILKVIEKTKISANVSLIPIFNDPLNYMTPSGEPTRVPITENAAFINFLKEFQKNRGSIIWHGVTHQYDDEKNPFNGVSGADCEFYDCINRKPVAKDSPTWVVERLEDGMEVLSKAEIKISAWLTPHYDSSPLDSILFAQLFNWNVGRQNYGLVSITQAKRLPEAYTFENGGVVGNGKRLEFLKDLSLTEPGVSLDGQILPYEVYGDVYGARMIPENVGFLQPETGNIDSGSANSIEAMKGHIKRNRVLRDVWASFFLHPFLFNTKKNGGLATTPGDTQAIEDLIETTKDLGYEFIELKTWVNRHKQRIAPIIEVQP